MTGVQIRRFYDIEEVSRYRMSTKLDFLAFGWVESSCEAERPTDGEETQIILGALSELVGLVTLILVSIEFSLKWLPEVMFGREEKKCSFS